MRIVENRTRISREEKINVNNMSKDQAQELTKDIVKVCRSKNSLKYLCF